MGALAGLVLVLTLSGAEAAAEGRIAVIGHPGTDPRSVAGRNLADVFRRTLTVDAHGTRLVPVNLPGSHPLRRAFSLAVLRRLPEDLEAYWNERYFHGVSPPYVVTSIEAMLRFVAATPGAIGYVPACAADARVAVLRAIDVAADLAPLCPHPSP